MPLLRCLPLEMHSPWKTKSAHCPSVCKSPGPLVTFSQPSGVTTNFDFERFASLAKTFQPDRSLPLKIDFSSFGRRDTARTSTFAPAGADSRIGEWGGEELPGSQV